MKARNRGQENLPFEKEGISGAMTITPADGAGEKSLIQKGWPFSVDG
jgi:hypothetical protein